MDYQTLFNIVGGIAAFFGGWWLKTIHESVRDLQNADKQLAEKVSSIEILVAGGYIRRDEFDRALDAIFKKLDRIEDRVSHKMDRGE